MFSAMLTGGLPGSGGTAIVSVSTQAPSIHMTLIFNGIFLPDETSDVPISIKLHTHDKQTLVIDEVNYSSISMSNLQTFGLNCFSIRQE